MNVTDTAQVLAKLAAFDQRTVGSADIAAWHEIIGYLQLSDCLEAVTAHYREQTTRAMPADIRRLAIGIRDRRQARERQLERRLAIEARSGRDRSHQIEAVAATLARDLSMPAPDDPAEVRRRAHAAQARAGIRRPPPPPPPRRAGTALDELRRATTPPPATDHTDQDEET